MCVGGGSGPVYSTAVVDTSTQPIKSKYPLTEAQKKENARRRKLLERKSLLGTQGNDDKGGDGNFGGTPKSTSFGGFKDASGGFQV
jgi:hypothetical protein